VNIVSDVEIDIDNDITTVVTIMIEDEDSDRQPWEYGSARMHRMKHWMRHMAIVPKGFLRFRLLKMLNEKSLSGSEIMSEMEKETNGYWKPSPGSIYPLLAWLQDKGYINEAAEKEPGIRRYTLTEQGKTFLDQEAKRREELDRRLEHFGATPGFVGPMWSGFDRENAREIRKVAREFGKTVLSLFHEMKREHSKEAIEQATSGLGEMTKKLQEITSKLQEHGSE
jgi:DNA-binding PadR family transcriptional regulator